MQVESVKCDLMKRSLFNPSWLAIGLVIFLLQGCNSNQKSNDQISISPVLERDNHLFLGEGPVGFKIDVGNQTGQSLDAKLLVSVSSDFGVEIPGAMLEIRLNSGESKDSEINLGSLEPGFYNVEALVQSDVGNNRIRFAFGVRPEEIISPLDRPDDFEEYWIRARKELGEVDPRFKMIRQDSLCTKKREVYILEMQSLGNVTVRGWYARPVKEGVYPAVLHVQGYSTFMIPDWMYQGDDMVALGLNIRGHGFSQDQINPGFPGYLQHHVDDKEQYIYRGAYMDCIRAVDFLYSRDEVDTSRVAVEGGSQGGALSFATAALDNQRIDLCIPHVPFLSDFKDYFKVAHWPANEFAQYFEEHPEVSEEEIFKNLSYIDIKNLAPWIKAPVFMTIGLVDETCPPHINFAAYNQLNVPKEYRVYPDAGHSMPSEYYQLKDTYIKQAFGLE